jgi:hypothetical protein
MLRKRGFSMIRVLLGSAFPVVGLALVAGFAGPDLVTGLGGAPMVVAGSDPVDFAPARFDGGACASTLLYGETHGATDGQPVLRVIAMALGPDGRDIELGVREIPAKGTEPGTVVLLFDQNGRLVGLSRPPELQQAATAHGDCAKAPKPTSQAPI